jgi:hypothetical protein
MEASSLLREVNAIDFVFGWRSWRNDYSLQITSREPLRLPTLHGQTPTWAKAAALAKEWELKRLADRLNALANQESD